MEEAGLGAGAPISKGRCTVSVQLGGLQLALPVQETSVL